MATKLSAAKLASSQKTGTKLSSSQTSAHIRDVDKGYDALVKRFYALDDAPAIDVGVLEAEGSKDHEGGGGVTVLDVAIWNEFGTEDIPERSFLRAWFDENVTKARELVRRLLENVVVGKRKLAEVPEVLGATFVGQIQKRISAGIAPENAPSTIAQKGSDKPLINKGQLRSSITHRARSRGPKS